VSNQLDRERVSMDRERVVHERTGGRGDGVVRPIAHTLETRSPSCTQSHNVSG